MMTEVEVVDSALVGNSQAAGLPGSGGLLVDNAMRWLDLLALVRGIRISVPGCRNRGLDMRFLHLGTRLPRVATSRKYAKKSQVP